VRYAQRVASGDLHRALNQHGHARSDFSRHENCLARGVVLDRPKTAKTIDFTRLKLRKHLLAARIDRRHAEPSRGNQIGQQISGRERCTMSRYYMFDANL
jgi:hypothetical protein